MPVTIASIESELLIRLGPFLTRVGLDGASNDGTNATLRGPIRWAVGRLGLETADAIDVADGDLAGLDRATYERLLLLAEYKALQVVWGNWAEVDQKAGEESQSLSQLSDRLEKRLEWLRKALGPLAEDPESGLTPGPSASGLIRKGTCYPAGTRAWAGRWWRGTWSP